MIDCRTLMVPKNGSFQSVELTWKVRQDSADGMLAGPVKVEIRTGDGVSTIKEFKGTETIDAWMDGVAAGTGLGAKSELAAAVKSAASGAQLILAGGSGSAFTLIANGSVSTTESRRWISGTAFAVSMVVLLLGLRTIYRRVMGRA